jgi:hypothetical protein
VNSGPICQNEFVPKNTDANMQFCTRLEVTRITGLSHHQLKRLRLTGQLQLGIHWIYLNSRSIAYNPILITDWIANRRTPEQHQIAIRNFLASLPSSQPPVKSTRKNAA